MKKIFAIMVATAIALAMVNSVYATDCHVGQVQAVRQYSNQVYVAPVRERIVVQYAEVPQASVEKITDYYGNQSQRIIVNNRQAFRVEKVVQPVIVEKQIVKVEKQQGIVNRLLNRNNNKQVVQKQVIREVQIEKVRGY